jgi:zinc finger protein
LELNPGTLGGRFTTLEGILNQVYEELDEKVFARGDSVASKDTGDDGDNNAMGSFLKKLKAVRLSSLLFFLIRETNDDQRHQVMTASVPFTIILDDPLANSYIQNLYAPDDDPNMITEIYERSHFQNEELGLNDMNVDDYGHVDVVEGNLEPDETVAV